MSAPQKFRSALNGFNREDVVRYIEYLNSVHTAEINQLNSELEFLRNQEPAAPAPVEVPTPDTTESDALIEQQATRIRELFDRCKELETQLAAAQEAQAHAEEKLQAVLTQQNAAKVRANEELEAYRRAEQAERIARERAQQIRTQTNAVLADATVKAEAASAQIAQLATQASEQLQAYQDAMTNTQALFRDVVAALYAIKPEE